MATYVFSDVHGHAVTLDRLLERVSPGADDRIFMLGDMIDRGPDPVSVLKCCRALSEAGGCVLLGNHEDLMLDFYETSKDLTGVAAGTWLMNGGSTTLEGLDALPTAEKIELLDWVDNLPLYAYAVAEGRPYIMVHAGIRAGVAGAPDASSAGERSTAAPVPSAPAPEATDNASDAAAGDGADDGDVRDSADAKASEATAQAEPAGAGEGASPDETAVLGVPAPDAADGTADESDRPPLIMGWSELDLQALLAVQDTDDLLWIRDAFWGRPTGLLDERGQGPIVIAGHTPTPYLANMADRPDRLPLDENGLGRMVKVGACAETYGVADRWDIDCGAAGGAGFGNILLLRLDDEVEFYEPILEGE